MIRSGTYFIQAGDGGPIKIGKAVDVQKRLGMLQTGNHEELRLLLVVPRRDLEGILHHRFAEDRLRGEWFRPSDDLLGFIRLGAANPERVFAGRVHVCRRCVVIREGGPAAPQSCIEKIADFYAAEGSH